MQGKRSALKGPYQNYVINYGSGMVVVKMFNRNDKQRIVQDDIDDNPHRGGRWFKILRNLNDVILIWFPRNLDAYMCIQRGVHSKEFLKFMQCGSFSKSLLKNLVFFLEKSF